MLQLREAVAAALRRSVHRIALRARAAGGSDKAAAAGGDRAVRYDADAKRLSEYGLAADSQVDVKDLGPQVGYRLVFIAEYAGPIAIVLAVALGALALLPAPLQALLGAPGEYAALDLAGALRGLGGAPDGSAAWTRGVQALGVALWVAHFAKRELETLFVHKFSRPTMPLANLFKNCAYYWLFALAVVLPLCSARYTAPPRAVVAPAAAAWLAAQAVNFAVHWHFASARAGDGDRTRDAPRGALFALVSCPNYTAEVLGWVAWTALTHVAAGGLFTLVGLAQMTQWALQKHAGYLRADKAYAKLGRKAIIPFVL